MASCQGELRDGMIERSRAPCRRTVAVLAGLGEIPRRVVRVLGLLIVREVALDAARV